jgi:hypothetical protein
MASSLYGTAPQDFSFQVFYESISPGPLTINWGNFDFFRKLAKIFTAQGAPPVSTTLVANGKNLQSEGF